MDPNDRVTVQETAFTNDVLGRRVGSTWNEAVDNGGVPFDVVVIGAGMFGAYCAEKIFRNSNLRVLVLDAGCLVATEHVQKLTPVGLRAPTPVHVEFNAEDPGLRDEIWGSPWRSATPFPGVAYCLGGGSLFWGGWAPQLTEEDLALWPASVAHALRNGFVIAERETGVADRTEAMMGPLFDDLKARLKLASPAVASIDAVEDAPLTIQAGIPSSGLLGFDKWNSASVLIDALRAASTVPLERRRLFYVPRAQVVRLQTAGDVVSGIEVRIDGRTEILPLAPTATTVLANGTIESTRLALESFPRPLMGRNLMSHLRSDLVVRVRRSALSPDLPARLETAALLVRGSAPQARFHLQVTAASVPDGEAESMLWRLLPDLDLLEQTMVDPSPEWIVLTLRGLGEMIGNCDPDVVGFSGSAPSWIDLSDQRDAFGLRRAWVNLEPSSEDHALWDAMDAAALGLVRELVRDDPVAIEYLVDGAWRSEPPPHGAIREGLGASGHEAGTLWLGHEPADSITNLDGRFHHIANAYVAGPALFPRLGSAGPALPGLALARRTALAIVRDTIVEEPDFAALGNGGLARWCRNGEGAFVELGGGILEANGGPVLLHYAREQFDDFVLRGEFQFSDVADLAGICVRLPATGPAEFSREPDAALLRGYEIRLDAAGLNRATGEPADPRLCTGAIAGEAPATGALPEVGVWHRFEIEALGPTITVRIDGEQTSRLHDATRSMKGFVALHNAIAESQVQFRRLRIKRVMPVVRASEPTKEATRPPAESKPAAEAKPKATSKPVAEAKPATEARAVAVAEPGTVAIAEPKLAVRPKPAPESKAVAVAVAAPQPATKPEAASTSPVVPERKVVPAESKPIATSKPVVESGSIEPSPKEASIPPAASG